MKNITRLICGAVLTVALSVAAQTSQTIVLPSLSLPPVKITIGGQTVSIPQPSVPLPSFTVQFPKQAPQTNWVTMTNWVNVTNWVNLTNLDGLTLTNYLFIQVTNVTPVFVTNTLPNFIPLAIIDQMSVGKLSVGVTNGP